MSGEEACSCFGSDTLMEVTSIVILTSIVIVIHHCHRHPPFSSSSAYLELIVVVIIRSTMMTVILQMGNKTKKCNLANESKAMVEADKKCRKAYGECRK